MNVIDDVTAHNLCVGCGLCVATCPFGTLRLHWNGRGDRVAERVGECRPGCRVCLRVCPFGDVCENEDDIAGRLFGGQEDVQYADAMGFHLACYVGYSKVAGQRLRGASGGMVTWFLEELLRQGLVDRVGCVSPGSCVEDLFQYRLTNRVSVVRASSGSRYFPVPLGRIIPEIRSASPSERIAIVGLPCMLKGLRLAAEVFPDLKEKVCFTLGLTCNHLPNRYYTEYLSRLSGIDPDDLARADYRIKEGTKRAGRYHFRALGRNGKPGKAIPFSGRVSQAYRFGYFQLNPCNYCDDVFAETADACFMDAWLPEFERDPRGHTMMVVRNAVLKSILEKGIEEGTCFLEMVPVERVAAGQQAMIFEKRVLIRGRLHGALARGEAVPRKRVTSSLAVYITHRREIERKRAVQDFTKRLWPRYRHMALWPFYVRVMEKSVSLILLSWRSRLKRVVKEPRLLFRPFRINKGPSRRQKSA